MFFPETACIFLQPDLLKNWAKIPDISEKIPDGWQHCKALEWSPCHMCLRKGVSIYMSYVLAEFDVIVLELPVLAYYGRTDDGLWFVGDGQVTAVLLDDQLLYGRILLTFKPPTPLWRTTTHILIPFICTFIQSDLYLNSLVPIKMCSDCETCGFIVNRKWQKRLPRTVVGLLGIWIKAAWINKVGLYYIIFFM